jgi:RNA polymerase sigma factor (sigma-70 family)
MAIPRQERERLANQQPPLTRPTLIGALRQGYCWEEFVALYGRLILFWARRDFGLQASDADNLCQEVLIRVWRSIDSYDPARGRFRQWLYTCTRNAVFNLWRSRHGEWVGTDHAAAQIPLQQQSTAVLPCWSPGEDGRGLDAALAILEEEGFALEELQQAMAAVRQRVQPNTWKAFLLFEIFELTAKEIAPLLSMKPTAVNQAVFRVRQLLQQALAESGVPYVRRKEPSR